MLVELTNTQENHRKFYRVASETPGSRVAVVRWGRIGTRGQEQRHEFTSEREARAFMRERIREKLGRGYSIAPGSRNDAIDLGFSAELARSDFDALQRDGFAGLGRNLGMSSSRQRRGRSAEPPTPGLSEAQLTALGGAMDRYRREHPRPKAEPEPEVDDLRPKRRMRL